MSDTDIRFLFFQRVSALAALPGLPCFRLFCDLVPDGRPATAGSGGSGPEDVTRSLAIGLRGLRRSGCVRVHAGAVPSVRWGEHEVPSCISGWRRAHLTRVGVESCTGLRRDDGPLGVSEIRFGSTG